MGTNYYAEKDKPCVTCGVGGTRWHIGKSSAGWQFLFASYPEQGLVSFEAWKEFLKDRVIEDEYGEVETLDQFINWVESKQDDYNALNAPHSVWPGLRAGNGYLDAQGYRFSYSSDFS